MVQRETYSFFTTVGEQLHIVPPCWRILFTEPPKHNGPSQRDVLKHIEGHVCYSHRTSGWHHLFSFADGCSNITWKTGSKLFKNINVLNDWFSTLALSYKLNCQNQTSCTLSLEWAQWKIYDHTFSTHKMYLLHYSVYCVKSMHHEFFFKKLNQISTSSVPGTTLSRAQSCDTKICIGHSS